ncbi:MULTISPECIES: CBS domain-containing protein [unclassified Streptomyces]|uniref:CBS domain-containing protein n=1 Tax=unclassified Streptomyces TaxID=2593676 RepID=UPI0033AB9FAB
MAPVQLKPRPIGTSSGTRAAAGLVAAAGPQVRGDTTVKVWGDMTVEVALSVMAGARAGHLLICDADDQCTGSVTLAQLVAVRDSAVSTDTVRLSDVVALSR